MAMPYMSILDLDRSLRPLLGELCWEADWGEFTSLSLQFGTPRIELLREPMSSTSRRKDVRRNAARRLVAVRGRWMLWVRLRIGALFGRESAWQRGRRRTEGSKWLCVI